MSLETEKQDEVIAVDFDGTISFYEKFDGPTKLGKPIPAMVNRVKQWLAEGKQVVIFSARVWPLGTLNEKKPPQRGDYGDPEKYLKAQYAHESDDNERTAQARQSQDAIEAWLEKHVGRVLPVTCIKTPQITRIYDDRAVAVEKNTGKLLNQPEL